MWSLALFIVIQFLTRHTWRFSIQASKDFLFVIQLPFRKSVLQVLVASSVLNFSLCLLNSAGLSCLLGLHLSVPRSRNRPHTEKIVNMGFNSYRSLLSRSFCAAFCSVLENSRLAYFIQFYSNLRWALFHPGWKQSSLSFFLLLLCFCLFPAHFSFFSHSKMAMLPWYLMFIIFFLLPKTWCGLT